jgi:hypothetical protein
MKSKSQISDSKETLESEKKRKKDRKLRKGKEKGIELNSRREGLPPL